MKKKRFILVYVVVALCYAGINHVQKNHAQNKISEAKKLFLEANLSLSEKRFADSHGIAEKLITDYAGDYQISLYLRLYANTFYFLDEDFQKGMLRPTPPGIQKRIEELKAKKDKTVIDLVTLAWIANGPGGDFSTEYLEGIIKRFPNSVWADWAETELEFAKIPGRGTITEERSAAFYEFCTNFMKTHPNTHLTPRLLCITANSRRRMSEDKMAKDEAVRTCHRILQDYPDAEYECAEARRILRELLGDNYKEAPGCSAERDRIITQFYCVSPEPDKQQKWTTRYIQMKEESQTEQEKESAKSDSPVATGTGLPAAAYAAITIVAVTLGAGLILLLKKKATSRGK